MAVAPCGTSCHRHARSDQISWQCTAQTAPWLHACEQADGVLLTAQCRYRDWLHCIARSSPMHLSFWRLVKCQADHPGSKPGCCSASILWLHTPTKWPNRFHTAQGHCGPAGKDGDKPTLTFEPVESHKRCLASPIPVRRQSWLVACPSCTLQTMMLLRCVADQLWHPIEDVCDNNNNNWLQFTGTQGDSHRLLQSDVCCLSYG